MNATQIATKYRLTLHNLQTGEIASRTARIAQELLDFVDYECLLGGYDMTFDATTSNFGCIYPEGSDVPVGTWSVTERKV